MTQQVQICCRHMHTVCICGSLYPSTDLYLLFEFNQRLHNTVQIMKYLDCRALQHICLLAKLVSAIISNDCRSGVI